MTLFKLYIENARRQKVSDYYYYPANTVQEARSHFRNDKSFVDWLKFDVVAVELPKIKGI